MAKTRKQKEEIVSKIEGAIKGESSVFVGFTGISVAQESTMRRQLRGEGLGYLVAKKTLLKIALKNAGHNDEVSMPGEVAVAYSATSTDATAAARRVHAFGKEFGVEKISILGGLFEGRLVDAKMMLEIATIPSMQVLRGMFANIINSPRQRFAVVLSKVAETKVA
jgi:large subunit ribosomal protein L10